MPVSVEPRYAEKIEQILEKEELVTDDLKRVLQFNADRQRDGRMVSPSLHFDATEDRPGGRKLHLRVLVWRSADWRERRQACYRHHRKMAELVNDSDLPFQVPPLVKHGSDPLIWDVTEFVPGVNLPWELHKRTTLSRHLHQLPAMVATARALEVLPVTGVSPRNWKLFVSEMGRMAAWAERMTLIDGAARKLIVDEARTLVSRTLPRTGQRLAHGDYGPNNILFAEGHKPWLIDFDDLRYSAPGDSMSRLVAVSYSEKKWSRSASRAAREALNDDEWQGFRTMHYWHTMNLWRQFVLLEPPKKGIKSLSELEDSSPWAAKQVAMSRWPMEELLASPGLTL